MTTLYVSQQGCYVCLQQETLLVKYKSNIYGQVQLPLVEQILIFGMCQVTTQVIRACLQRDIPIGYLSKRGYCYGRLISIQRGHRYLSHYQQQLTISQRLAMAKTLVIGKLKNSKALLRRQLRRHKSDAIAAVMKRLDYFATQAKDANSCDKLLGFEGIGARSYFSALGECLRNPEFVFTARVRYPPGNEVNAMLSFGYQILWNHLLTLIELQGLDPYQGCLHEGSPRHAALASDLIEEFRAPLIDSLVLRLVNNNEIDSRGDFVFRDGACYLNESGRKKFLRAFLAKMEESVSTEEAMNVPRWDWLDQQVKAYKQFIYDPRVGYQPLLIH